MSQCKIEGCNHAAKARGMCNLHWLRWRKHGDANILLKTSLPAKCEVPGCDRKPHSRWNGKALCGMHYLRIWSYGSVEKREHYFKTWSMCSVEGCDKPSRSPGEGKMCEMHYYRVRRTGNVEIVKEIKKRKGHSDGYIMSYAQADHPLASSNGFLYEHRKILFGEIGWGPHKCYWCGTDTDWMPGERTKKGALVVDHLNGNRADNNIQNLVPSCHRCNSARGMFQKWAMEHGGDAAFLIHKTPVTEANH